MVTEKFWWHVARSGGVVAWALLAASVLLGLVLSSRLLGRRAPAPWVLATHRWVSGLSVVFTGVHVAGTLLDGWLDFTWVDAVVPFASDWRPLAVAWGVVALQLLVALQVSSLLKSRMSHRTWRRIHHLAGPAFVMATVHLLTAGTDATNPVVLGLVAGTGAGRAVPRPGPCWSPKGRFPRPSRRPRRRERLAHGDGGRECVRRGWSSRVARSATRGPHSPAMQHDPERPIARAEARELDARPAILALGLLLLALLLLL